MTKSTLIIVFAALLLAAACGSSASKVGDRDDLPEGWARVQVREGFVGREFANPLAGFEIDLPPGWRAGEGWPGPNGPAGWIAAAPTSETENVPILRFNMGDPPSNFPESENSVTVVAGVLATIHLAPTENGLGPNVGIFYEHIPGGPAGVDTPSLDIGGDNRGFDDQVLLTQVLTSIRYAEVDALPELPTPRLTPSADWVRTPAPSAEPTFSVRLPPGWSMEPRLGVDSVVGVIVGPDDVMLYYEYGQTASPYDPLSRVREHRDELHQLWEEAVGDVQFRIARAVSPEPHPNRTTGGVRSSLNGGPGVGIYALGEITGNQQDIVLAILRSVELQAEQP